MGSAPAPASVRGEEAGGLTLCRKERSRVASGRPQRCYLGGVEPLDGDAGRARHRRFRRCACVAWLGAGGRCRVPARCSGVVGAGTGKGSSGERNGESKKDRDFEHKHRAIRRVTHTLSRVKGMANQSATAISRIRTTLTNISSSPGASPAARTVRCFTHA